MMFPEVDMGTVTVMILSTCLLLMGFLLGWLISSKVAQNRIYRAEVSAEKIVDVARREAEAEKRTAQIYKPVRSQIPLRS